jgi:tricorn protease-like protein
MRIIPEKLRIIAGCIAVSAGCGLVSMTLGDWMPARSRVMAASKPSFNDQIVPILQRNCLACHSSAEHKGRLVLDSYDALMAGGRHGQVILPHDANGSRIVGMLEGEIDPRMPLNADPLSAKDIETFKAWINAGAEGPSSGDTKPTVAPQPIPDIQPQVEVTSPVTSVKFSPSGRVLSVGGYRNVRLIDAATGKLLGTLAGHADYVRSIAFSPDGTLVAAGGGSPQQFGEIKIWNVETHELIRTIKGHKDCIYSVAWSPDGKLLASGSYDKQVKLWDAATGKETLNLQDHIDAVFAVAFSPDGQRLASASQDRTIKIWNVATGKRVYTLSDATDGLTSLAYSPSGDELAAVGYDKTIYIWKLTQDDGQLRQSLIADEDSLLSLKWSHDGKMLVTASSDGSIRFRDRKLNLTGVIDHQPDWVEALDVSPDGRWLAAGRYDGTLSLYDTTTFAEVRGKTIVFDGLQSTVADIGKEAASR